MSITWQPPPHPNPPPPGGRGLIKAGDDQLQVLHTPGHSSDSVCLYNFTHRILFSGDTQLRIRTAEGVFAPEYIETLRRLSTLRIETIYSGHDEPIDHNAEGLILETLRIVRNSKKGDYLERWLLYR